MVLIVNIYKPILIISVFLREKTDNKIFQQNKIILQTDIVKYFSLKHRLLNL